MTKKIGVGLYGNNGHQVTRLLEDCSYGEAVACAGIERDLGPTISRYPSIKEMLQDPRVELVSLCSPRRDDQAADAIACLRAGRHVYAEKPAALSNERLDEILAVAREEGREFHEIADTVFRQPFHAMRALVRSGCLGEIVQVWAQKSYPANLTARPQDEGVDGGLMRQCAIHAVRMVEHLTGIRVAKVESMETQLGNTVGGGLRMASGLLFALENGGVGTIVANYCNPPGFGRRGNDQVRIFGTRGMAELTDDAQRSRVILDGNDLGPLDASGAVEPFFYSYLRRLLGLGGMPISLEEELHPLRVVNDAKAGARLVQPHGG